MKLLGSKADFFLKDGQTWFFSAGLQSDVTFKVGEISFNLHKFPLLSRSSWFENHVQESTSGDEIKGSDRQILIVQLHAIPGGSETFLLVAKFCYGIRIELTPSNVVSLRCAAAYLGMTEDYGERNLIWETENYLNEVLYKWDEAMIALRACEEVLEYAEMLQIVSRCIDSLAVKTCQDPSEDWWYKDVSSLSLPLYRRLILAGELRGMIPERIAESLMFYAMKYLPLMSRQSSCRKLICCPNGSALSFQTEVEQRGLLEEIVSLLPDQKGITPTKFLLKILRLCIVLDTSSSCRESLEKLVGVHLDEADFKDLLIPNIGYSVETLYDVECVKRMVDYFIAEYGYLAKVELDQVVLYNDPRLLTPIMLVANLVDSYLAEVASDVNLKLAKFISIAAVIPDNAREFDDGLYRAIDVYLKAHPWLTDSEKDQICRLMNSKKLSLEATTHAAQNERLPIRFISQILYVEQIRLQTSVASWYFDSDKIVNTQNRSGNISFSKIGSSAHFGYQEGEEDDDKETEFVNMKDRVVELEKQCSNMKREMEKFERSKGKWNSFCKRFGNTLNFMSSCSKKTSKHLSNQIDESKKFPTANKNVINDF